MKKLTVFLLLILTKGLAFADSKLTQLTQDTTAQSTDLIYKVDTGNGSRSMTIGDMLNASLTASLSTATINQTNTGSVNALVITSTGTGIPLTILPNGFVSNGYQNRQGALTIGDDVVSRTFSTYLVLVDSTTDAQNGGGMMEIWSDSPNHNDPKLWFHVKGQDSSPEIRDDANAPNWEMINTSTDNAHGLGKWEPAAVAYQGTDLQINNRAWNNSTFETIGAWHPLSKIDIMPGLYISAQNNTDDGAVVTSPGTSGVHFFTTNSHTVGLTAAPTTSASWVNAIPSQIGSQGQMMYHNGSVADGLFTVRQWEWSGNDLLYNASGLTASTVTANSQFSGAGLSNCGDSSHAVSWNSTSKQFGCQSLTGGTGGSTIYNATSTVGMPFGTSVSTISLTQGMNFTPQSFSTSVTLASTHSVIFINSSATSISTVTLPSAAALSGQWLQITKVDTSTGPVVILAATGQSIVGLSTMSLTSRGMSVELISDGTLTWYFKGRMPHSPAFLGNNQDVASAATLVSSATYFQAWDLDNACDTKSITYHISIQSGNIGFAIYNAYGVSVVSTGPFVTPVAGDRITALPTVNLQPGLYYLGFGFTDAVATISRYASDFTGGMYSKTAGLVAATGAPVTNLGYPPSFDNPSTRSPSVTVQCWNAAP